MIKKLKHTDSIEAKLIYKVFQNSYRIEAKIIGVVDFPPLQRTCKDISESPSQFYGFWRENHLAGVIEIEIKDKQIDICSLVVEPSYFRKGIGGKLLNYALTKFDCKSAIIETAVANQPAVKLYEKYGFVENKKWITSIGIEKIAMQIQIL